jgi:subfamily B ATP-binding cassette protein MsbA
MRRSKSKIKQGLFSKFSQFLTPYLGLIVTAFVLTVGMTLLNLPMPFFIRILIDDIVGKGKWNLLIWLLVAVIVLFIMQGVVGFLNTSVIARTGQRIIFDVRLKIYQKLQQLSLSFYDRTSTGAIVSRMMDDVNMIQNVITGSTISIVTDMVTLCAVSVILIKENWMVALAVGLFLPFYAVNFRYFVRRIRTVSLAIRNKMDEIFGALQEKISGVQVVKAFAKERFETKEFVTDSRESLDLNMNCAFLGMSFSSIAQILSGIGTATVLCLGGWFVIEGTMSPGEMMFLCSLAGYVFGPTARLSEITYPIQQASASIGRIFEILDTVPDVQDYAGAVELPRIRGHVRFDNVSFAYKGAEFVVRDINLDIPEGTTVAFVGHTGCGKTTLINLLLRFYDPTKGKVIIDGWNISKVKLKSIRQSLNNTGIRLL